MTPVQVADLNWLDSGLLYLQTAPSCEIDRPVFQGDVFADVPLPVLPMQKPGPGPVTLDFQYNLCMVVPHPCQCYHGDRIRPRLTVAPLSEVANFDNFGADRSGAKDKFALPGLPTSNPESTWTARDYVADLGRLTTVRSSWLLPDKRLACLSQEGLGLLAKRILGFQLRYPIALAAAMAYTAGEWSESFLMQAWVRRHGSLRGFTDWLRSEQIIEGINAGDPVVPYDVRAGALDVLLSSISGEPVLEDEGHDAQP